jgi:hypothetical protein
MEVEVQIHWLAESSIASIAANLVQGMNRCDEKKVCWQKQTFGKEHIFDKYSNFRNIVLN